LIPITAIVLTYNESANIDACLQAMSAVDDIVVVDSGSTDDTIERARAACSGVRVFDHPFKDFGDQRNWALDNAEPKHPWVLFVDADEYCDSKLLEEIAQFIASPGPQVGGYIAGRNYFLGQWLKYSTMYPSYQLRLLKLGQVRYRKEGHGQREVTDGPLRYMKNGWRHEAFSKGVHQWVGRHNQYSTDEIELIARLRSAPIAWKNMFGSDLIARRRALKTLATRLPGRAFWRFLYTYLFRRGILDGRAGLDYCLLRVAHDLHIGVKLREHRLQQVDRDRANPKVC